MKSLLLRTAFAFGTLFTVHATAYADPVMGGTLRFARNTDSEILDPVLNNANADIWILTNLYSTLILPAPDGKGLLPGLATAWSASADGKSYTLKLRQGTKFADGSPVTVDDVIWSLNRARNPNIGIWNFLLASIANVSAPDDNTILITLKNPDPSIPAALATFNSAIMPHKLFEAAKGATDTEKANNFALHPIGDGPFVLSSWERGSKMVLKRNPYYFGTDKAGRHLPYLDEVDLTIVPDDATRILQLQAGQIDATEFIPYVRVKELQADPNLTVDLFPSTQVTYLQLSVFPKLADGTPNPLSNTKVRQALNYAISKEAIIKVVTHDLGTPMHSFFSSTTPLYYGGDGPAYPFNMAKAKALLKEAGYDKGFELTALAQAGKANDTATLTLVQQMWSALGVKLKIQQMDETTLDNHRNASNFQVLSAYWTNDIADPNEMTDYSAYYPNIKSAYSGWNNPTVNKLFEQSQTELDPAKRAAEYKQIQQIYVAEAPEFFMYETPFAVATRKNVVGFQQSPLGNDIFDMAYFEK
ncbi:ABC transporter substrate-binding protein [Acidisoma cellulosilytica]|uniref:ABC transporter substrate-binding protein n=1 Tax=Acidisoma cellulosilyticum TaxID=2802395 RepID=A0A963Z4F9_9PROT|nr:ABC transporter substrate-binding protein [Acidisoma cellulosilyticum]MCB8882568.1 ABC transporter substrate-binding protein [Acidisoma cellulosilyticum]